MGFQKLTGEQQKFIVERLARFVPPFEIIKEFTLTYNFKITNQDVYRYNLRNPSHHVSKRLREYFEECRKKYNENIKAIPGANRTYRLEQATEIYETLKEKGNLSLALKALDQLEQMDNNVKDDNDTGKTHINQAILVKNALQSEISNQPQAADTLPLALIDLEEEKQEEQLEIEIKRFKTDLEDPFEEAGDLDLDGTVKAN